MTERPKVLFVLPQLYKGGAETALLNLLRALGPDAADVYVLLANQLRWPGVVSLVGDVPPWVHLLNPAAKRPNIVRIGLEVLARAWEKLTGKRPVFGAFRAVRGQVFDWAISYGEWTPQEWVARYVQATHKAAWVHADLDKAAYFRGEAYFKHNNAYETYLFVSDDSRVAAEKAWPALRGKSRCIHNVIDADAIRGIAEDGIFPEDTLYFSQGLPVVLTCANIRREKNHLRQVQAMALLKQRGLDFIWLNVGATYNREQLIPQLQAAIRAAGLEKRFFLLGERENPYGYMQKADAMAVFSDHESWSMVITEALALGKPVLATHTSGARAQITDGVDGLLCGFTAEAMADTLERFLADAALRGRLATGAAASGRRPPAGLAEFKALTGNQGNQGGLSE